MKLVTIRLIYQNKRRCGRKDRTRIRGGSILIAKLLRKLGCFSMPKKCYLCNLWDSLLSPMTALEYQA